ncbi:hypothetical protein FOCC_FOCC000770 [Frankliniella occidentalis]|nr:hypothetical protein FOCC_FOCC000770 [Frankliniella occidentalis]
MAASSEFRRQQSRVWWSSFHGDEHLMSALGSPIPRSPAPGPSAAAAAASPAVGAAPAPAGTPGQQADGVLEQEQQGGRDASSSPSTSHKSQDSGFSDSDGSHRAAASPLSTSPEVTEGAQLPSTPSPTHSRLQLCLSGACTSTPRDQGPSRGPARGPASFGGHATPGELRRRLSQDDSCIQSRPLPAIPVAYRRQRSAEEQRRRTSRAHLSRSVAAPASLDTSLEDDELTAALNQTFPLPGPPDSGHRAPRCFIKNRKNAAANSRRQQQQRYTSRVAPPADEPSTTASSVCDSPAPLHATVVRRPVPDGGEDTTAASEHADILDAPHQHLLLDVTSGPGLPAHTSTPKALPAAAAQLASPMLALAQPPTSTPTRRPAGGSAAPAAGRRAHDRLRMSARPVNLLNNYEVKDEAAATPAAASPCARLEAEQSRQLQVPGCAGSAVAAWLGGLRLACEPECSVTLQSKALLGADPRGLRQLSGVQLASPQGLAHLQRRAQLLSGEYTRLCG